MSNFVSLMAVAQYPKPFQTVSRSFFYEVCMIGNAGNSILLTHSFEKTRAVAFTVENKNSSMQKRIFFKLFLAWLSRDFIQKPWNYIVFQSLQHSGIHRFFHVEKRMT